MLVEGENIFFFYLLNFFKIIIINYFLNFTSLFYITITYRFHRHAETFWCAA